MKPRLLPLLFLLSCILAGCASFPSVTQTVATQPRAGVDVVDAAIDAARELRFPPPSKIDKQNVLVEFGHFGHTTTGITAQMRKKGDGTLEVTVVNGSVYGSHSPDDVTKQFVRLIEEKIK
jgi:hypothetical protein